MIRRTWLDLADPGPRRLLVAVTLGSLAVGSVLLEQLQLTVWQVDLVSLGWLGGLALLWGLLRWRTEPRVRARRFGERARREQRLRQRGFLVGGAIDDGRGGIDALSTTDPAFSEPALADRIRRLLDAHWAGDPRAKGWIRCDIPEPLHLVDVHCVAVTHRPGRVECTLAAHGPAVDGGEDRALQLELSRPSDGRSARPDDLARLDGAPQPHDWHLVRAELSPAAALPLPTPTEDLDADVRALVGRDPTFDPEALRVRALEAIEGLADADVARVSACCTPSMARAAEALHGTLGAAHTPTLDQVKLTSVSSDGWYDLAELGYGALGLAFLRPTGETEAPWLLWRAWRGEIP